MSYHVYIANPGFKDEPIEYNRWIVAAKEVASKRDNFVVKEKKGNNGTIRYSAHLANSRRQWLRATPYGLIHAQDPTKELIEIMFEVAGCLDAKVYSERSKPYKDVADWEKRTQNFRQKLATRRLAAKKKKNRRRLFWLMVITTSMLIGIFS